MHAKNFLINKRSSGQTIEAVSKCLPKADIIPPLALVIKSIYTVDGSTLMVSSEKKEVFPVFDLVCKEKAYGFNALLTTVNIIS